jgi:hypothetical protein
MWYLLFSVVEKNYHASEAINLFHSFRESHGEIPCSVCHKGNMNQTGGQKQM